MKGPAVLANRNFVLLLSGNALSLIGFHGVRIAYPLLALSTTGSAALAGWVGFAISLPVLLFQIPAGMAADYWDRRRIMLTCQLAGLIATCAACSVVLFDPPQAGLLLMVAAFIEGTAFVFFGISEIATIRDITRVEERPVAYSFSEAKAPIALVMGRAVGATVFGIARWLPFAANAAAYVFSLITLSALRTGGVRQERESPGGNYRDTLLAGVREVRNVPFLRTSTLIGGLSNMGMQVVILLIIVEFGASGEPVWMVGVILGASGIGGIVGSFSAAWLTARFSAPRVYRCALWAWAALILPITLSSQPLVVGAAWFCMGGIGTVVNVALTLFQVNVFPEAVLGRAVSAISVVTDGAVALGALAAGFLLTTLSTEVTGYILIAAMLGLAVAGSRMGRDPRTPAEAGDNTGQQGALSTRPDMAEKP